MSNTPKWTPGPWETAKPSKVWQVNADTGNAAPTKRWAGIALVVERKDRGSSLYDSAEAEANARMIAAAPELYEALEDLVRQVVRQVEEAERGTFIVVGDALAALAKARGQ